MRNDVQGDESQDEKKGKKLALLCEWACQQLRDKSELTRDEFKAFHEEQEYANEADDWSKTSTAVMAVLNTLNIKVERKNQPKLGLYRISPVSGTLPENPHFRPYDDKEAKRHIGEVVAKYLYDQPADTTIVLGSGTTCLHVGLQMKEFASGSGKPYPQNNIWTTNLALAIEWCRGDKHPAKELLIPGGTLALDQLRFSRLTYPEDWTFSIAVLGVHSCHLDQKGQAQLYSGWEPTALDNQWFMNQVVEEVIACLPSAKLEGTEKGSGKIFAPAETSKIQKFLVTEAIPRDTTKLALLEEAGWNIVTNHGDWKKGRSVRSKPAAKTAPRGSAPSLPDPSSASPPADSSDVPDSDPPSEKQ